MQRSKKVQRACPLCSSKNDSRVFAEARIDPKRLDQFAFASRKMPELMHHRLVVCQQCGLLYASPIPPLKSLAKSYQEAAFDSQEEARYAAHTYAGFLPGIQKNLPNLEGTLDIGTGDGAFLAELVGKGFKKVAGVEPSRAPIAAAAPSIRPLIRQGLFKPGIFRKDSLALITCFQTLEHLSNPLAMGQEAYRILKKGGAFFAVCHNRFSLSARILGMRSPIFDIEHLQLFSPESAKFMLEKVGFTRVEVHSILNTYPLHYWVKMLPFPLGLKRALITALKKSGIGALPIPLPAGNLAIIGYK